MNFETKYIWESLPLLLQGLQLTILISMVGLAGGFIIGLLAGVCRALGGGIAKTLSLIFVELIRGTPIMVQVMFIYFGKAPVISGSTHHNRQDDSVAVEFSAHVVCGGSRDRL